ncbi:hypothetical protein GCM10009753_02540 [Streptantibioticus ferralitis]
MARFDCRRVNGRIDGPAAAWSGRRTQRHTSPGARQVPMGRGSWRGLVAGPGSSVDSPSANSTAGLGISSQVQGLSDGSCERHRLRFNAVGVGRGALSDQEWVGRVIRDSRWSGPPARFET